MSLLQKVISFSGEIGAYGELYEASGIEKRRPSATGRIYFRPTVSFFRNFTLNFDLLLSTEGSSARQSLDQIAIHPEWSWGRADVGDFSRSLSEFTLNGITIRGGGVEIYPGLFRFAAIGGLTQRAVEGNATDASFERFIAAGRIGIGREGGDFFDITILKAKDNSASLKIAQNPDSLFHKDSTSVIDSLYATTQNDPFLTTPQENLVGGINTGFSLFDGLLTFNGEAAGCMYTRDMNAAAVPDSSILSNKTLRTMKNFYTLRLSTSADYAIKTQIVLNLRNLSLRGGFTRVGASYTSLGLASQINDREGFNLGMTSQLFEGGLSLNATYDHLSDNLAEQKLYTTQRSTLSVNLGIRPANWMFAMLGYVANGLSNDASNDTMKIDNSMASYMSNLSFFFPIGTISNTLTLTAVYQTSDDGNMLRKNYNTSSTSLILNFSSALTADLSVSPFGGLTRSEVTGTKTDITTVGVGFGYRMFEGKLNNSLSISSSTSSGSGNISVTLQSGYPLGLNDNLSFNVRYSSASASAANPKYNESQAALTYTHRF